MLNPVKLNEISLKRSELSPSGGFKEAKEYFDAAFNKKNPKYELPMALYPVHVHIRASVQRSCFTMHGQKHEGIDGLFKDTKLVKDRQLIKYKIDPTKVRNILWGLNVLGISYSTLFPDFDGLAKELGEFY